MADETILNYAINDPVELNLSYMPFITNGGIFIPTFDTYHLGTDVLLDLLLPGKKESIRIEGKIVWITPQNALHHVLPGIGVQFTGVNASATRAQVESFLDKSMEIGGYTYGMTEEGKRTK